MIHVENMLNIRLTSRLDAPARVPAQSVAST